MKAKMQNKKLLAKIVSVSMAVLMTFTMGFTAACGGTDDTTTTPPTDETTDKNSGGQEGNGQGNNQGNQGGNQSGNDQSGNQSGNDQSGSQNSQGGTSTDGQGTTTTAKYDMENDPVSFSVGELDGVFNPFFSTSAYDGEIAGMTQISMLSSDANGQVAYGEDEPVMTLDYTQTMYNGSQVTTEGSEATTTVYEFLIKNGVKDSTGADITIKDVLFNIYVYLDPMYNGSSTMYSTDIVGLDNYRTGGYTTETLNNSALSKVNGMMDTLDQYAKYKNGDSKHTYSGVGTSDESVQEVYVQQLYAYIDEMAEEDWTSAKGGVEDANTSYILVDNDEYKTNKKNPSTYDITQPWEVFAISEGWCQYVKINDKYKTDDIEATDTTEAISPRYYILIDSGLTAEMNEKLAGLSGEASIEKQKEICLSYMNSMKTYSSVNEMLYGSSAGTKMREYFRDIALEQLLANNNVDSIEGITTYTLNAGESFNGTTYAMSHDVLRITINKVDPKAIWNFAFTVAPMHYYSNEEQIALYDGVSHFGVEKNSKSFRDNVLKATEKIGLPVGAGTYMASTESGGVATSKAEFYKNYVVYFERNPYFYTLGLDSATATQADLERGNDNTDSIHNAYVKYLRYQVMASSSVMNAMLTGQIDYSSEISAKQTNINTLNEYAKTGTLSYVRQDNNGYGYVGINPKYVPDIEVRRLIMLAMDRDIITSNYYTNGLGSIIERPMTTNSWAYPDPKPEAYYTIEWFINHYKEEGYTAAATMSADDYLVGDQYDVVSFIGDALKKVLGYTMSGDVLAKKLADGKTYKLDYTFTIAGDTKDHPAYIMFTQAAEDLNSVGMKIKVKTDVYALSKLANGSLTVWAAAWSSAIDPDMYQVYHKDSQATSTNNWGYSEILSDSTGLYATEKEIINDLSEAIDEGRSYLTTEERQEAYATALDLVMELAVELPTYQRVNLLVYNSSKIDASSLNLSNITAYSGLIDRIWELKLL